MQVVDSGIKRPSQQVQVIWRGGFEGLLLTRVNREPKCNHGTLTLREPHDESHEITGIFTCKNASLLKKSL